MNKNPANDLFFSPQKPYGIIYKATNLINGKIYIGQTIKSLNKRISEHKNTAKRNEGTRFHVAIRKYGFEKFTWEIICNVFSRESMIIIEHYYINLFRSYEFDFGYNSTMGDNSPTPEIRERLSKILTGKKRTSETRKRISDNHADVSGKNNPMYGLKFSADHCNNISRVLKNSPKNKGANNPAADTYFVTYPDGHDEIIKCLKLFCKEHGINYSTARGNVRFNQKPTKNTKWFTFRRI